MKRFYKIVTTRELSGEIAITLDGKTVKTKQGNILKTPYVDLANAIMREWAEQGDIIVPESMPLTQLLNTRLDRISAERPAMTKELLKYLDTDLIFYQAPEPFDLVKIQEELWQPWRNWFSVLCDAELKTTTGLFAIHQDEKAHQSLKNTIEFLDDDRFTILQLVTSLSGSVILALVFTKGLINSVKILKACTIEEEFKENLYNAEKYGPDPLFEKKRKAMIKDFSAAEFYRDVL